MSTVSTAFSNVTTDSCSLLVLDITETALSQANLGTPKGVLSALISPTNKAGFMLDLSPSKERPSSTSVRKVYTSDTVGLCNQDTTPDGACATPSFSTDDVAGSFKSVEHRIEQGIQRKIVLDVEEFKAFCLTPAEYLTKKLLAMRDGVHQEINSKLTDTVIAYAGTYADGTSSISATKAVSFTNSTSNFDPRGYAKIKDEYAKLGHQFSTPIIVGGSHISSLETLAAFSGGTNAQGTNLYRLPNVYQDYGVDIALANGENNLITWSPQSIQVATYNDVSADMVRLSVPFSREKSIVPDPFGTGLGDWSFYFDVDSTGCKYELRWELWFDAITPVPYDGTCAKKPILLFTADCDANACPDSSSGEGEGI